MNARRFDPMENAPCSKCGAWPAPCAGLVARDPEYAARVVASVHGALRASDFVMRPLCAECAS